MTITRLLIVSLLATVPLHVASAESRQPENSPPNANKPDLVKLEDVPQPPTTYSFSLSNLGQRVPILNPERDATCYTMRTYVADRNFDKEFVLKPGAEEVAYTPPVRKGAQPDSPLTGTYTTCTPSLRFEVKTAVQPVESGSDGK